jgi:hypothetical protein
MRLRILNLIAALAFLLPSSLVAQPISMPGAEYRSVVDGFRAALLAGDTTVASGHLASTAQVLIDGEMSPAQSFIERLREQQQPHACLFAGASSFLFSVSFVGDIRVLSATYTFYKVVENRTVTTSCAESAVLSQVGAKWVIHAIHWSSGRAN